VAVLDLGHAASLLVLLYRGVVIYERVLSDGGFAKLRAALVQRLKLEEQAVDYVLGTIGLRDEASLGEADRDLASESRKWVMAHLDGMLPEVRASLSYAQHQYPDAPVDRVAVMGGGAAMPGLSDWLAAELEAPVRIASPASLIACPDALLHAGNDPGMTLAMGLAMHEERL
jgi:Tfp pilus assembly PilM family ATPase